MKKIKTIVILLAASIAVSSCGLFHKSCNCPHFGKVKGYSPQNTSLTHTA